MKKRLLPSFAVVLMIISFVSCRPSERMQIKKEGWVEYCTIHPSYWSAIGEKLESRYRPYVVFMKGDKYMAVDRYELERPYPIEWYRTVFYGESVSRLPLIKGYYVFGENEYEWRIGSTSMYCNF